MDKYPLHPEEKRSALNGKHLPLMDWQSSVDSVVRSFAPAALPQLKKVPEAPTEAGSSNNAEPEREVDTAHV